jgi:hypothetical protein
VSVATAAVRAAAALLPRRSRHRYREQWLGELRDAEEVGIRPAQIALGSLAFAVTFDRPLPSIGRATPAQAASRSRLAAGLALAAAAVGVTRSADLVGSGEFTVSPVYDLLVFLASMLLLAFAVAAPVAAVLLVTATRGIAPRVRAAVWLLVLASLAPLAKAAVDGWLYSYDGTLSTIVSTGSLAYPAAVALIVVAAVLLRRAPQSSPREPRSRMRRVVSSATGAVAVLLVGGAALAHAALVWAGREPLVFGWQPAVVTRSGPSGFEQESISPTTAMYEEWLALKLAFEQLVQDVFAVWAVAVLVLALVALLALLPRSTAGRAAAVVGATLCLLLIAHAAMMSLLELGTPSAVPFLPSEALLLLGRWGLVAIVLATVGGVRYRPRPAPAPAAAVID